MIGNYKKKKYIFASPYTINHYYYWIMSPEIEFHQYFVIRLMFIVMGMNFKLVQDISYSWDVIDLLEQIFRL